MDPNLIKAGLDSLPESTVEKILNPTAQVLGDATGGLVRTLFSPLLMLNIYSKEKLEAFERNVHAKVNQIPNEYRDSSKLPEFLETLEKSKYKIGEDDIRIMFENLLSKTLDSRSNESITPRYSTVLSQLSSKDAIALNLINEIRDDFSDTTLINAIPISKVLRKVSDSTGSVDMSGPVILSSNQIFSSYTMELDNLQGLGIIDINFKSWLSDESFEKVYASFETSSFFDFFYNSFGESDDSTIVSKKGVIKFTAFGKNLLSIIN
ncbi:DUF4393 domain-containing protein [Pediococcus sp. EKM202D]|uniref:DUF4393 domain-containing protein n=1 Tax=unclassified Pediococcus TaxID=554805 RepID=UPI00142E1943|nr:MULTISPECIES: DUF4393 domain-containing protein [unclassified Pediococcus]KAF5440718.1 DUF4393 domain-containing protein [Pediococcus sp. EKM202D]KAF5441719.1 DUF4393 domain-containing protein [Pediococcus sp. EKM201D]